MYDDFILTETFGLHGLYADISALFRVKTTDAGRVLFAV